MNQSRRIAALSAFLSFLLLSSSSSAQNLTELQRQERCQTNRQYIAEYENELQDLGVVGRLFFESRAREQMGTLHKAITNGEVLLQYFNTKDRMADADRLNLKWDGKWDADVMAYQKAIRDKLVALIELKRGKSIRENEERGAYLQAQAEFHRDRLAELKCDEKAATSTDVAAVGATPAARDNRWKSMFRLTTAEKVYVKVTSDWRVDDATPGNRIDAGTEVGTFVLREATEEEAIALARSSKFSMTGGDVNCGSRGYGEYYVGELAWTPGGFLERRFGADGGRRSSTVVACTIRQQPGILFGQFRDAEDKSLYGEVGAGTISRWYMTAPGATPTGYLDLQMLGSLLLNITRR